MTRIIKIDCCIDCPYIEMNGDGDYNCTRWDFEIEYDQAKYGGVALGCQFIEGDKKMTIIHETLLLQTAKMLWEYLDDFDVFDVDAPMSEELRQELVKFYTIFRDELMRQGWKRIGIEEEKKE